MPKFQLFRSWRRAIAVAAGSTLLAWPLRAQTGETPQNPQPTAPATQDEPASQADPVSAMFPHLSDTRYWLSGQANFIFQTHPPFHAPYSGTNSLSPNYEKATS